MTITAVICKMRARILESGICAKGRMLKKVGKILENSDSNFFGKWEIFVHDQKE